MSTRHNGERAPRRKMGGSGSRTPDCRSRLRVFGRRVATRREPGSHVPRAWRFGESFRMLRRRGRRRSELPSTSHRVGCKCAISTAPHGTPQNKEPVLTKGRAQPAVPPSLPARTPATRSEITVAIRPRLLGFTSAAPGRVRALSHAGLAPHPGSLRPGRATILLKHLKTLINLPVDQDPH